MNDNAEILHLMLVAVWSGMALGILSGAALGLFFHREDWMGGYGSFRRRLARLGHISFFGLAFVNLAFAVTLWILGSEGALAAWAAISLLVGAATMPTVCFLTAWRKPFRHLFFIPVSGVMGGVVMALVLLSEKS